MRKGFQARRSSWFFSAILLVGCWSAVAPANHAFSILSSLPWAAWEKEFVAEKYPVLKADYVFEKNKGGRCQSGYNVKVHLETELKDLDLDLQDDGRVAAKVWLENLHGDADGFFRSHLTLCRQLPIRTGIGANGAFVSAMVKFTNPDKDPTVFELKVIETKIDRLKLSWMPDYAEKWLTDQINWGLQKVWATKLGDWLAQKIADAIRNKLPKP